MSDSRMKASTQAAGFRPRGGRGGFTLVELLVVIGIIVILIGILIPTISHVRQASRAASTQSLLVELQSAIEQYYQDYRAYPGPLSNDQIYRNAAGTGVYTRTDAEAASAFPWPVDAAHQLHHISMAENMVLGLVGGLEVNPANGNIYYRASLVGTGPRTLAAAGMNANRVKNPYLANTVALSAGHFEDGAGAANDSIIPEFVDRFQSPMPSLYLRARVGAPVNYAWGAAIIRYYVIGDANNVRGTAPMGAAGIPQYDINQIFGYVGSFTGVWPGTIAAAALDAQERPLGGSSIGEGKSAKYWFANVGPYNPGDLIPTYNIPPHHGLYSMMPYPTGPVGTTDVWTPFTAPAYFRNPAFGANAAPYFLNAQDQPRARDGYILISAGPDRVYGTADDITSFGAVLP